MRFILPCCAACCLLLSACSEARYARYNTRYLPTASSLDYDGDVLELPAKPPALDGNFHGTKAESHAMPRSIVSETSAAHDPMPQAGKSYQHFD